MAHYQVRLCSMEGRRLCASYVNDTIEAQDADSAEQKAKEWAKTQEIADGSWLEIAFDGRSVACFENGSF